MTLTMKMSGTFMGGRGLAEVALMSVKTVTRTEWSSQCEFLRDFEEESTPTSTTEDLNVMSEEQEERHTLSGFLESMGFQIVEQKSTVTL